MAKKSALQDKVVLVVDDEPGIRKTLRAYLENEGYEVSTLADGVDVISNVRSVAPDVIILDVMLPGIDGIEVLRQIRQESSVFVLMLSARGDESDRVVGLRMGADEVTIIYRRSINDCPAREEELHHAEEEGISFHWCAQPVEIMGDGESWVRGMSCVETRPGPLDRSRRRRPLPVEGSEFVLDVDTVIYAIGSEPNPIIQQSLPGLKKSNGGTIEADPKTMMTSVPGIFAGGDLASMERFVTHAVGMGKQAAAAIAHYLEGRSPTSDEKTVATVGIDTINTYYYSQQDRIDPQKLPTQQRLQNFNEVQQPLQEIQADAEALRCFSCGTCIYCDNCYAYCPDMAITRLEKGYAVKSDYCKGCGLCVAECPTGSIVMQKEYEEITQ